jgi:hypothetical protein
MKVFTIQDLPRAVLKLMPLTRFDRAALDAAMLPGDQPVRWKREAAVAAASEGNASALEYVCERLKAQRPVRRSKPDARWRSLMQDVCVAASKAGSIACLMFAVAEQDRYRLGKVLTVDCAWWAASDEDCFWWLMENWCPVDEYTIFAARDGGLEWIYYQYVEEREAKKLKHMFPYSSDDEDEDEDYIDPYIGPMYIFD